MKKIALAGNPNCGKTTMFNAITGANQRVGNYSGVTVDRISGFTKVAGEKVEIVDLPGTYSLTGFSDDELVARNYLINEDPDVVISVVDASNIERSLNLTLQLIEMGMNVVVALNMVDVAKRKGFNIDGYRLSEALGVPVASTICRKGEGLDNLLRKVGEVVDGKKSKPITISYSPEIDELIKQTKDEIKGYNLLKDTEFDGCVSFWAALKLIEGDSDVTEAIKAHQSPNTDLLFKRIKDLEAHVEHTLGDSLENIISGQRYGVINALVKTAKEISLEKRRNISDKIDLFLTHKFLGPIFLFAFLYFAYDITFTLSEYPVGWFETFFGMLNEAVSAAMPDGLLKSLVVSGIIDGVGGVLGFTPLIMFMFFLIAIIEDSGYMARMAFILDRVLRMFGVHGNSIISYIIGGGIAGGCAVPGIMAARTLRDKKEKLATILTVPFMNCGAKLPVFALLISAFFAEHKGPMMLLLTILSWAFALGIAFLLRKTALKGEASPFIMELPPYRMPTLRGLLIHTWQRTWMYVKKAGTLLLPASIVVWALMTFPVLDPSQINSTDQGVISEKQLEHSIAGRMGKTMEVVTRPLMGFDWKLNIALIGGAAAKEVIVSTLGTAYSIQGADEEKGASTLAATLQKDPNWTPYLAFALIVFTMLYFPCIATVAVIQGETRSWKITLFAVTYSTTLATIFATIVYQVGALLS